MIRPRLLDLFCGAGGAAMGYHRAGFDVIGVDINPQPHYPFEFHQGDAMTWPLDGYDAIHASPPCQASTNMSNRWRGKGTKADGWPNLIAATRDRLIASGRIWILENVVGARVDMLNPFILSGGTFGLGVDRPRLFDSNVLILVPTRTTVLDPVGVYGDGPDGRHLATRKDGSRQYAAASLAEAQEAMGMDWADWHGTKEAIPPAYTEHIGAQLMAYVGAVASR